MDGKVLVSMPQFWGDSALMMSSCPMPRASVLLLPCAVFLCVLCGCVWCGHNPQFGFGAWRPYELASASCAMRNKVSDTRQESGEPKCAKMRVADSHSNTHTLVLLFRFLLTFSRRGLVRGADHFRHQTGLAIFGTRFEPCTSSLGTVYRGRRCSRRQWIEEDCKRVGP